MHRDRFHDVTYPGIHPLGCMRGRPAGQRRRVNAALPGVRHLTLAGLPLCGVPLAGLPLAVGPPGILFGSNMHRCIHSKLRLFHSSTPQSFDGQLRLRPGSSRLRRASPPNQLSSSFWRVAAAARPGSSRWRRANPLNQLSNSFWGVSVAARPRQLRRWRSCCGWSSARLPAMLPLQTRRCHFVRLPRWPGRWHR